MSSSLKWKRIKHCIVPSCKNCSQSCPDKIFFRLPLNECERRKWLEATGAISTSSPKHEYFCENHFDAKKDIEDYLRTKWCLENGLSYRARLRPGAIPFLGPRKEYEVLRLSSEALSSTSTAIQGEALHSVNSEGVVKMKEEVKEELEDPLPQDLCHIKMEEDFEEEEAGEGETEEAEMNDSAGEPREAVDPLSYPGDCYFSCQYCGFETPASNVLKEHILNRREEQCPISCSQCTFNCSDLPSLRVHRHYWHGEERPSSSARGQFSVQTGHSTDRPHSCPHCDYTTVESSCLKNHIQACQSSDRFYSCPHCEYSCALIVSLERHIQSRHSTDCLESGNLLLDEELTGPCSANADELTVHPDMKNTASSELKMYQRKDSASVASRRFACDVCQARFIKLSHLKTHHRTHTKEKPYACDICQARFTQASSLNAHKRIHTQEKPYGCNLCQARFYKLSNLKAHERTHTKEKPYACDLCQARFTSSSNLRIHERNHTQEKPYACDICQARFTQSSSLKVHQRIHANERPYTCDICQASFTVSSHLKRHKKALHE